jgi:hypothetical protein
VEKYERQLNTLRIALTHCCTTCMIRMEKKKIKRVFKGEWKSEKRE